MFRRRIHSQILGRLLEPRRFIQVLAGPRQTGKSIRQRGSIPKLFVLNTALMSASYPGSWEAARAGQHFWGRLVETSECAHLVNGAAGLKTEVFYWRDPNREVDFVLRQGDKVVAIEVKSGGPEGTRSGLDAFAATFNTKRSLIVGRDGIAIAGFLSTPVERWMRD